MKITTRNTIRTCIGTFLGTLLLTLASCHKDDDKPAGEFASGVFVVNEGNFHSSDGTLSFYRPTTKAVEQDIYGAKNNGLALGDVVQSMTIDGAVAYMVVNNDNKVEVANSNTMVKEYTLSGLSLPRYFTTYNGKGYLTEWVSFVSPGDVLVINLQTHVVEDTIAMDYGTENIIALNNKLFVSNNFSNTVLVIDPSQNVVVDTVTVGSAPGAFAVDKNNKLWVICGGGYDGANPANDGALYEINATTNEVEKTIALGANLMAKVAINGSKDKLYYFDDQHIYSVGIADANGPASPIVSEAAAINFYGIGVDPATDIIYVGDAVGFSGNGTVYRYNASGAKLDTFTSGRGPNGFVFR